MTAEAVIASMRVPPFAVHLELAGWALFWARLEMAAELDAQAELRLAALRAELEEGVRSPAASASRPAGEPGKLAEHPTVAALRALFRAAGCDPTRYRPSSEALLRRLLKGEPLPVIHPLVDLNNCLSVALAVPCCVLAEGSVEPPLTLRAGRAGEAFESLRGPFSLEGKPLLADRRGPFGTPITDSQRVKVGPETRRAWLVAYLPHEVVTAAAAAARLRELLAKAPVARLELTAETTSSASAVG
ncbi:MAG TPA: phenylalanine--tRNA ligase beta subunit-related protein [Thermoanaerobaculia bacterium]|nr:phenylalanine--tRNA ligase beta subunit-related protein [Thermoanaerobaculia bacterium]